MAYQIHAVPQILFQGHTVMALKSCNWLVTPLKWYITLVAGVICVSLWRPLTVFFRSANTMQGGCIFLKEGGSTEPKKWKYILYGYGSIPINTILRGMNIHLPAILMFTRVQGFDTLPYVTNRFELWIALPNSRVNWKNISHTWQPTLHASYPLVN